MELAFLRRIAIAAGCGLALLSSPAQGAPRRHILYLRAEPRELDQRLAAFPTDTAAQVAALQRQFDQIGAGTGLCKQQEAPRGLLCTVPGQSPAVVLVVALLPHVEKQRASQLADAPLVLLPLLAESAVGVERKATHLFAAVESGPDQQTAVRRLIDTIQGTGQRTVSAVVLLSQLGRAAPIVGCVKRDSLLQTALAGTAATMALPIRSDNLSPCPALLKDLDTTFADRRVLITSPGSVSAPNPAGKGFILQQIEALNPKAFYLTYQYLCTFLAYLDSSLADAASPAAAAGPPADVNLTAELRACVEQARAARGLPAFASSAALDAFARRRAAQLATAGEAAMHAPGEALDALLQADGYRAKDASETLRSVAEGDRATLCDTLTGNRLLSSPGPLELAVDAQVHPPRIVAAVELAVPADRSDGPVWKQSVLQQVDDARRQAGHPSLETIERSDLDSLACEVGAMQEPSLAPIKERLKREHKTAHIVLFHGRSSAIPAPQLATLRDTRDDQISVGVCRDASRVEGWVVLLTEAKPRK